MFHLPQLIVFLFWFIFLGSRAPIVAATLLDPGYYAKFVAPHQLSRLNNYMASQRHLTSAQANFLYDAMNQIANFSGEAIPDNRAMAIELFGASEANFLLTGRTSSIIARSIWPDGYHQHGGIDECDCSLWERYFGVEGDYCEWPHHTEHTGLRCWNRLEDGTRCKWVQDGSDLPPYLIGCGFWATRDCDGVCLTKEPPPYVAPPTPTPTGYQLLDAPSASATEWGNDLWNPPPSTPTSTPPSTPAKETVVVIVAPVPTAPVATVTVVATRTAGLVTATLPPG